MGLTQVSTDGVKNDAITKTKIPANQIETSEIASGAVTSTQILDNTIVDGDIADATISLAKLEHGTSSNDGKFLRANNGADPTFETVNIPAGVGGATGVDFNDDVKARFGTGNDIEIFHSSDQSYIRNSTGNLRIEADALRLRSKTGTENYLKADVNGNVELYRDNAVHFRTEAGGAAVVDGNSSVSLRLEGTGGTCGYLTGDGSNVIGLSDNAGHYHVKGTKDSSTELNFDNSKKLETYTDGVKVTGVLRGTTSGFGIDFAETSNTSGMTSEVLDDYEEGTFTPEYNSGSAASACFAGGVSYNSDKTGIYRKIGNMVYFFIKIQATSGTAKSGQLIINGLPFTSGNFSSNATAGGGQITLTTAFNNNSDMPTVFVGGSSSQIKFFFTNAGDFAGTNLPSPTGVIHLCGQYPTT